MAKNVIVGENTKKQFADVNDILKNPSQRAKLTNYVDQAVACKVKIMDENESIKRLREIARDELDLQPKMFNTLVSLFLNNNFDEKKAEIEQIEVVIEAFFKEGNPQLPGPDSDNDD